MVCNRCIEAVEKELSDLNIDFENVELGRVEIESITDDQKNKLSDRLINRGFELLEDKTSKTIERIKTLIIQSIHNDNAMSSKYSDYLEKEIGKEYSSISSLFSSVEGITIERFIILQKIERIKELITYDQLSLSEISYKLGYSSVQHLSNQFKKNTGMTPSEFKKQHANLRKPIDSNLGAG